MSVRMLLVVDYSLLCVDAENKTAMCSDLQPHRVLILVEGPEITT